MSGIQKIKKTFNTQKVLMGYLMGGDGGVERTLDCALALIRGGVNMLEIGVPFSDPVADGPVIQRAALRALNLGINLDQILDLVKKIREQSDIPIILFSYLNPILSALNKGFFLKAKEAGVDGLLIVDSSMEALMEIQKHCIHNEMALIQVITPSTSISRIKMLDEITQGFLYYACRKGITGIKNELPADFEKKMREIRQCVKHPVVVGFGISSREMVSQVWQIADGAVVGSLFVKAVEDEKTPSELEEITRLLI